MKDPNAHFEGKRFEETDEEFWKMRGAYVLTRVDGCDVVHAKCPGCDNNLMLGPKPPASGHSFRVNDDGSVTCELYPPEDPTNSNSILCPVCEWHGELIAGLWRPIGASA